MQRKEINQALTDMVHPILSPLGFKKYKGADAWIYRRDAEFGYNEVPLLIWQYGDIWYVSLIFTIRINELNKIFLPYSSYVIHENDQTLTIGAEIKHFGSDNDKIKVENEVELKDAVRALKDVLVSKALPFFEKYQNTASIDAELNRENRPKDLFCDDIIHRPIIGITAAALAKNPDFNFWENFYREKLKSTSDARKEKYERLVSFLKENILVSE